MIIFTLVVLGLIFGSFVNAFVWRLHEQEGLRAQISELRSQKKNQKKVKALEARLQARSVSRGRSMCPHCEHELAAKDLVPVLSWLYLRGRCRYCRQSIAWQYPAIELLTAVLFAVSYVAWPLQFDAAGVVALGCFLVFLVFFMALAVYDLRWYLLPDAVVLPLIVFAVLDVTAVSVLNGSLGSLWQPLTGGLIIAGLFWILFQVSKGAWIGGGDVKLAIVLGLLAGTPLKAMLLLFFASFLGVLITVPLAVRSGKNLKLKIPFGPFLLAATVIVVLYGDTVIHWYTQLFQLS